MTVPTLPGVATYADDGLGRAPTAVEVSAGIVPLNALVLGQRPRSSRSRGYRILSWVAPLLFLLVWELLSRAKVLSPQVLPAPSKVLGTAQKLLASGELVRHVLVSLQRVLLGFGVGAVVGLGLGIVVGLSRFADALLDRTLQMIRAVPFLALTPLIIVWFGVGESGKVFLIALGVTFPVYLNTVLGIRQVDPRFLEMSRVVGLGRARLVRDTVLPGALPSILNGVRLGLTTCWLALVIAETVGASAGIGFLSNNAREFLQTDIQVLVIIIYAVIGVVADLIARTLERHLLAWHPNYRGGR